MNATCKSCGAALRWITLPSGKAMPLDAEPSDDGNVVLADDPRFGAVLNTEQRRALPVGADLYRSHFSTCPAAAQYRRKR